MNFLDWFLLATYILMKMGYIVDTHNYIAIIVIIVIVCNVLESIIKLLAELVKGKA